MALALAMHYAGPEPPDLSAAVARIAAWESELRLRASFGQDDRRLLDLLVRARRALAQVAAAEDALDDARTSAAPMILWGADPAAPRGGGDPGAAGEPAAAPVSEAEGRDDPANEAVRARLRREVSAHRFPEAALDDWAGFYAKVSRTKFVVSPAARAMEAERTTLRGFSAARMTVEEALSMIERTTGITHRVQGGEVLLVPAAAVGEIEQETPAQRAVRWAEIRAFAGELVTALGLIGPVARHAAPAVEALCEHDDPQIAQRARAALHLLRAKPERRH